MKTPVMPSGSRAQTLQFPFPSVHQSIPHSFQSPPSFPRSTLQCNGLLKSLLNAEVVIAPPALYLLLAREHLRKGIEVAAQNVFDKPNGAFTGEISATQLMDSGIGWTLAGHSERRVILGEDDVVSDYCYNSHENA